MPISADPAWAWLPYQPDAERPWTLRLVGHLYRRAAFGANWTQLQQALGDGPQKTIDRFLGPGDEAAAFNRTYDDFEAAAGNSGSIEPLRAWWLRRMVLTPHPLLEKMTLFWHGHFAAHAARADSPPLVQEHLKLLRGHALGRFDAMLGAAVRDPALLLAFDSNANRRARPNDYFARNLLECITLGPGQASAKDIAEAARCFTGWFVIQNRFRIVEHEHDEGVKRVLGREGPWQGSDVAPVLLQHPATARFLVRKMYRWLISETDEPGEELLAPLAASLAKDWDIAKLVETMLRSNWFFSSAAYRQRVKGPVEFALGIVRALEELVPTTHLGPDLAGLGQDLFHPPSAKGWQGGRAWINSATLVMRNNLAASVLSNKEKYGDKLRPLDVAKKHGQGSAEQVGRFLLDLFLQGDVEPKVVEALQKAAGPTSDGDLAAWTRQWTHAVVALPEFQLC
jgi:uncharacterized protein (DUF1800 family)